MAALGRRGVGRNGGLERELAESRAGQILLSQRAFAAVEDLVDAEAVGELTLKGFSRAVPAVNVLGLKAAESRDRAEHEALDAMVHP